MLRSRLLTASAMTLGAVLFAPAVLAASANVGPVSGATALSMAPAATVLIDTKGHFSPLSNFLAPSADQASAVARPNRIAGALTPGIRLELANGRNWEGYGDLFPSAFGLTSNYLTGTTAYAGVSFSLTDELELSFGRSQVGFSALSPDQPSAFSRDLAERLARDFRDTGTTSASISWNFADWGGLAVTASQSRGDGSLLGVISGPVGAVGTETLSLGVSARVGFGEGWVTSIAYSGAVTQLDLSRNGLMMNPETVSSRGFGLALAKQGLFGDDAIGISVSRPLQAYTGAIGAALANTNQARESDVELGYVTTFLGGTLALQANAAYQLNAAGTEGENAVTGVARAKLKF